MEQFTSWLYGGPTKFTELNELRFFIHDEEHTVKTAEITPDTTLNTYLRHNAFLTGTKNMCLEGGCGACIVAVTITDPITALESVYAVNSCLVPIYMCSSWKIHTIESIGNSQKGYHPVQNALVKFNGTQCGFCSPGMVMSMYALYESKDFEMCDVENTFGGNICRCTGYRPILSAFKSLATDVSLDMLGKTSDIEDIPVCKGGIERCWGKCAVQRPEQLKSYCFNFSHSRWFKVFSINEIFDVFEQYQGQSYTLVSGDTAKGVYKRDKEPDLYIDITSVKKLLDHGVSNESLILGANMTLTNTIKLFYRLAKERPKFLYLKKLAEHIELVANVPVRNIGTLSGNLFTKYRYPEFPSDIFVMFETVGAQVVLLSKRNDEKVMSLPTFLDFNMKRTIIKAIKLPALDDSYKLETYKIMPRAENAHALINAGFLFKLSNIKVESARIVYGGIKPTFIHAIQAERYITNKNLFDNVNIQGLFKTLNEELQPDYVLPDPTPEFRKKLAIALCYKFILSIAPEDKISPRNKSGGLKQVRPVSSGTQDYSTNESMYPLTQPISKIEAIAQCSGEAQYIMDMPDQPGQLYAAFVLAKTPPNSAIEAIDPSEALALDGVVAFYSKDDVPGKNTFTPLEAGKYISVEEEMFCSGIVKYYYQPIGITVATSQKLAEEAAELVTISYKEGKQKPLLTIDEIIQAGAADKIHFENKHEAIRKGADIKHVVKGKFYNGWQYHFSMETQCCVVVAIEDGLDMFPSTQTINYAQVSAAKFLNIPANRINVSVRRIGGAYGGKMSRSSLISCAAALAAYKLRKPVKLWMPLNTNMNVIGKRFPCYCVYEVGCNDTGVIQYMNAEIYSDLGSNGGSENVCSDIAFIFPKLYRSDTWDFKVYSTRSDCHTGTPCRAPATTEAVAISESIMEHLASTLKLDPNAVRLNNMNSPETAKYLTDLINWAEVDKRKKEAHGFNIANRWRKRGIATVPMLFPFRIFGNWSVLVSIYQGDGSVSVVHGGIEMGQGINTKAAQICAFSLGLPLNQVSIKPSNALVTPNSGPSAGSITAEAVCFAIVKVCDILKERMQPVKEKLNNPTWHELIQQCYVENVDLSESFMCHEKVPSFQGYSIYGATCVETEVDILTGVYQIKRVDIIEDTGNSMSPQIDIGQVEGAFIMGLGYWTMENIIFDSNGKLLTNNTWTYKVPGAKDIPIDFRVNFPKNNPNPVGVFNSKATSEPSLVMACSVPFSIRNAVSSAREESNTNAEMWYPIAGPSTVENTFLNCLHDFKQYVL